MRRKPQRLVLIDGHAIIHRAYHALPPLTSPGGQQTNAVYGFISMLFRVITELKPAYLAVAFDLPVPTFRHAAYIAYQAHRPHMEQEMKDQIKLVHEVVEAAGIPVYTAPGFEADDVIGTLARQGIAHSAKRKGRVGEVVIVTGDRDMLQLIRNRVKVYAPIKGLSEARIFDRDAVEEYIGLSPEQIVDYKALIGDQSDNYPGVPGIGPKTAVGLLREFGSLERIYQAKGKRQKVKSISPVILERLERGREAAILSQKLARISTSAPVKLDLEQAKFEPLEKNEKFISKLRELGFKSLIRRLGGEEIKTKIKGKGQIGLL